MTKAELVKRFKDENGLTAVQAANCIEQLCEVIVNELDRGEKVPLPGIGQLIVKARAARSGRNPRTGAAVEVPAGKRLTLKVSKELKDRLNA